MKIAIAQITSLPDPIHNLRLCRKLIQKASANNAELVAFPETSDVVFGSGCKSGDERLEYRRTKAFRDGMGLAAKDNGMWVVFGCHMPYHPAPKKWRNACLTYSPSGELVHSYDMLHPYEATSPETVGSEASNYVVGDVAQPGLEIVEVRSRDGEVWRFGITIGCDIRYPHLFSYLRARGADAFIVPTSSFPTTTTRQWDSLLVARAIDNQAYILAPCQVGRDYAGRKSVGGSTVVGPCGGTIVRLSGIPDRKSEKEEEETTTEMNDEMEASSSRDGDDPDSVRSWEDLGEEKFGALNVGDPWSKQLELPRAMDRKDKRKTDGQQGATNESTSPVALMSETSTARTPPGIVKLGIDGSWEDLGDDEDGGEGSAIGYAILRKEQVIELRKMVPIWNNMRTELYGRPDGR